MEILFQVTLCSPCVRMLAQLAITPQQCKANRNHHEFQVILAQKQTFTNTSCPGTVSVEAAGTLKSVSMANQTWHKLQELTGSDRAIPVRTHPQENDIYCRIM